MTVLFLCTAHRHRGPLAEAMLRAALLRDGRIDVQVASAGVAAAPGAGAVPEAASLARAEGLDLSGHRARRATPEDLARADIIVVMEGAHLAWVRAADPAAAERCRLLGACAGEAAGRARGGDVPDAEGGDPGSFQRSYAIIRDCIGRLYRDLPRAPHDVYARAIEERLGRHGRATVPLSPADWSLLERWWDRGVPLWIVTESLDDLARRREASGDPSRPLRLAYCRRAVEERFAEHARWLRGPGGAAVHAPEPGDPLRAAAARLAAALRRAREEGRSGEADALERATRAVGALEPPPAAAAEAAAALRIRLRAIEDALIEAVVGLTAGEELEALRSAAAAELEPHRSRMTAPAYEATLARLVAERVREARDLPRLADL